MAEVSSIICQNVKHFKVSLPVELFYFLLSFISFYIYCQARIQRGSSCSYITAMECRVITGMPF